MYRSYLLLLASICSLCQSAHAQQQLTLRECINYAQQNSLTIKQAQTNISLAEVGLQRDQFSRLPSLNGSISGGYQFGRTIDPTSNTFENESIGFNSYGLNANVTLFGGGRINNNIKQSEAQVEAARLDADFTRDNLALNIANAYLSVLLAEEQLEISEKRVELSTAQLEQTDKLIAAGSLPENDRLEFVSQLALDRQAVVDAENQVIINYLNLKQLMEISPSEDIRVVRPEVLIPGDANPDGYNVNELYSQALSTQENVAAGEMRLRSAELGVEVAKANFLPSLSLFGSLNTNFSTSARQFTFVPTTQSQTVFINGDPVTFSTETEVPVTQGYPYVEQLQDNFGQSVGLNLNIPIYNNHQNKLAVEQSRLSVLNQQVQNQQIRQQLKADVQRAIADARASSRSLEASQAALRAAERAFENAQKQFDVGAINALEFSTSRNNLDRAEIEVIRAKYNFIFNIKRVEFYMGKEISL